MGCCRITEAVVAIVVLVFTFWNTFAAAKWIVALAAVVLLIHSMWCRRCAECEMPETKKRKR